MFLFCYLTELYASSKLWRYPDNMHVFIIYESLKELETIISWLTVRAIQIDLQVAL